MLAPVTTLNETDGFHVDPHVPRLTDTALGWAPAAPASLQETGLDPEAILDLTLKLAFTTTHLGTESLSRRMHLPHALVLELVERLRDDRLIDVLGNEGPIGLRFSISHRGRERAARLFEISGYVGPVPVPLETYCAFLTAQMEELPNPSADQVARALSELVLPERRIELLGLAAASGRSLFLHGPAGNGKTSVGRALHAALPGSLWIPRALVVDGQVIRLFDPQCHHAEQTEHVRGIDARWVRIKRPLLVVGGEMTMESFELNYSPSLRYYEAPLHLKANGGTLLIDDFGRQRVDPQVLLNRWIIPLEHGIDYLHLSTGQKIQISFRMMLIFATNLRIDKLSDPAFLRRLGYRVEIEPPSVEDYALIFQRCSEKRGVAIEPELVSHLVGRYQSESRTMRACEPRDLIDRALEVCRFRGQPERVDAETLDLAWVGYFGTGEFLEVGGRSLADAAASSS